MKQIIAILLLIFLTNNLIANAAKDITHDPLCKRYFERKKEYLLEKREQAWQRIKSDYSDSLIDYIFVEVGDTNFESYDYIFFGFNSKQGIIRSSYPYRSIESPKIHSQEHVAYVEINKMRKFFSELSEKIGNKITFRKNPWINDGSCYSFKIFIKNRNIEYSVYMPRLFPVKEVKMTDADIIASFIYKFFEKIELTNDRYIRRRVWFQDYKANK